MEKEYIIIYTGCQEKQNPFKIAMETKSKDEWVENRIQALSIQPQQISSISVGPKTVLEFYSDPNLNGQKYRVINSSTDKMKVYNFGCFEDHQIWRGNVRSFIIMTYDYYNSVYGKRYCSSTNQCHQNEMCLCPGGQEHPSWCEKKKRRCMDQGYFVNEFPITLKKQDMVYTSCLEGKIKNFGSDKMTYSLLNEFARECALDKKKIEGFSYRDNDAWFASIMVVVVFLLILMTIKIAN